MGADDVIHGFVSAGGGGFGDPLDREPESVRIDVHNGYVSKAAAEAVYGVAFAADGKIDAVATRQRRAEIRQQRISRSKRHATA
jgi:N-methylhydantoinase B